MAPEVRWTRSGTTALAYQVVGQGPRDIVIMYSGVSHLEVFWELPENVDNIKRLATLGRVILYDKRGVGLSDRTPGPATSMDDYIGDVVAVLDAVESSRAVLFAWLHEGVIALGVAARHPHRVEAVVAGELLATFLSHTGHPWGWDPGWWAQMAPLIEANWGDGVLLRMMTEGTDLPVDARIIAWSKRLERMSASPSSAARILGSTLQLDARRYLPDVHAPVLLLHDAHNAIIPEEGMRWLASQLEHGQLRVVEDDLMIRYMPGDRMFDEVEHFLTGQRSGGGRDRQLAVIMVSDISDSTQQLATEGGDSWRHRLDSHFRSVREFLHHHQGHEVDTAGDGFLATFSLASRAIACAEEMLLRAREDGLHLHIGLHAGEVTVREGRVTGMAVPVAARVAAVATADQLLITDTVVSLLVGVTGAPKVEAAGEHELKGVPGIWRLHRVLVPATAPPNDAAP